VPHLATAHSAKLALTFTNVGEAVNCEMTFAVRDTTDGIFTDPSLLANSFYNAAIAHLLPVLAPQVQINGVVFEDVRTVPYGGASFSLTPHAGTSAISGVALPTDTSIAVKKVTASLGRSGRGRVFWPLWNSGFLVSPDKTNTAETGLITSALADFQTAVETGPPTCEMGIISQQIGGVVRGAGLFEPIVSWGVADQIVDSQRRRLLGRGR
jgi:hypothetical protein